MIFNFWIIIICFVSYNNKMENKYNYLKLKSLMGSGDSNKLLKYGNIVTDLQNKSQEYRIVMKIYCFVLYVYFKILEKYIEITIIKCDKDYYKTVKTTLQYYKMIVAKNINLLNINFNELDNKKTMFIKQEIISDFSSCFSICKIVIDKFKIEFIVIENINQIVRRLTLDYMYILLMMDKDNKNLTSLKSTLLSSNTTKIYKEIYANLFDTFIDMKMDFNTMNKNKIYLDNSGELMEIIYNIFKILPKNN
uniref:Uncharacterized protein n=1 Tax=viral metagenome TaxID=1070528 RepID=A0A6C0DX79_9ZZZZ